MPRDHARIQVSIWDDEDFVKLSVPAQHAYFMLTSYKRLSYAGILVFTPRLFVRKAKGLSESKVLGAVKSLERERFVVTDPHTGEILVRSYVRHDGVMDRANMGKAVATAVEQIESARLKDAVLCELARLYAAHSGKPGFAGFKAKLPAEHEQIEAMASRIESAMPSGMASDW